MVGCEESTGVLPWVEDGKVNLVDEDVPFKVFVFVPVGTGGGAIVVRNGFVATGAPVNRIALVVGERNGEAFDKGAGFVVVGLPVRLVNGALADDVSINAAEATEAQSAKPVRTSRSNHFWVAGALASAPI